MKIRVTDGKEGTRKPLAVDLDNGKMAGGISRNMRNDDEGYICEKCGYVNCICTLCRYSSLSLSPSFRF